MQNTPNLILEYKGSKLFCSDSSLGFHIDGPLVTFDDGTFVSMETGEFIKQGPLYLDKTITLSFIPKDNDVVNTQVYGLHRKVNFIKND